MTLKEYEQWLNAALAGSTLIYHTGELARDRGKYGPKMEWIPNEPLHSLASRLYAAAELGLVILTQVAGVQEYFYDLLEPPERPRQFTYRATRTSRQL